MKKFISVALCLVCVTVLFSGCRKYSWVTTYDKNPKISVLESSVVARNDAYVLSFEQEGFNLLLRSATGDPDEVLWSSIPAEDVEDTLEKSTLNIRVQDTQLRNEQMLESSAAEHISAEKIDNGIKLTYYFDKVEISVPVCFTLRKDSVKISIDGKEIVHGNKRYQLIAAQPAPMLCRASVEEEDSYLFIPSGIGGTVENKITPDMANSISSGTANAASIELETTVNEPDSTGFRCYGLKKGNTGLFCIAEDTPGAVGFQMRAGDVRYAYSAISPMFFFADYDYFYGVYVTDGLIKQLSEPYDGTVSVGVYPLAEEDADIMGMAKCYRNYLIREGFLSEEKTAPATSPYSVTYYGGVLTTSSIAGVPTKTLKKMTSFEDAQSITQELTDATGVAPSVRLSGYGDTGVNIGGIAGGYQFASLLGGDKARTGLEEYCKKSGISLFTDFNLIYFGKSGDGFSYSGDSAKTAILHAAEIKPVTVPMRDFDESQVYRLLARSSLSKAVDKLLTMANKKSISGISLKDLGKVSYSDYGNGTEYAVAAKMETDTKSYLERIKKAGYKLAVKGGTYYSTGLSDTVFDAPVETSGRLYFKNEIPFYQLVFHGITPMYSPAINTVTDARYNLMLAASTGTGLGFGIIKDMDTSYMETNVEKLYAMVYEDNRQLIKDFVTRYKDIYESVQSSKISDYEILDNGITKTVFENGISIYANHTSREQDSPVGKLDAYGFVMDGEARS